jgi:hypothetical protein
VRLLESPQSKEKSDLQLKTRESPNAPRLKAVLPLGVLDELGRIEGL